MNDVVKENDIELADDVSGDELKTNPVNDQFATIEATDNLPIMAGQPQQLSPIQQMQQMKQLDFTVADMKDMLALQKEYEANEAYKAFNLALAGFKSETIEIIKDRRVAYENKDTSVTSYNHASLGNIVEITTPFLSKHGFSHRWIMDQADGGIYVSCILTHKAGHSESTKLHASPDNSGGKNAIQAVASTVTYLERYTFLAITGLATKDQDDDGNASGTHQSADYEHITPDQANEIYAKLDDNELNKQVLIDWLGNKFTGVEKIEDIPAANIDMVMMRIDGAIKNKNKKDEDL